MLVELDQEQRRGDLSWKRYRWGDGVSGWVKGAGTGSILRASEGWERGPSAGKWFFGREWCVFARATSCRPAGA